MNAETAGRSDLLTRAQHAAEILAANPRVQLVYLFGSALDPTTPRPRDVDLAVMTAPPLSLDELMRARADLVAATSIQIDLVSLNDAPIVLAHEIAETGRCLFARDPAVETEFVTRARSRYWDFKPYREEQWRLAGKRLEARLIRDDG